MRDDPLKPTYNKRTAPCPSVFKPSWPESVIYTEADNFCSIPGGLTCWFWCMHHVIACYVEFFGESWDVHSVLSSCPYAGINSQAAWQTKHPKTKLPSKKLETHQIKITTVTKTEPQPNRFGKEQRKDSALAFLLHRSVSCQIFEGWTQANPLIPLTIVHRYQDSKECSW